MQYKEQGNKVHVLRYKGYDKVKRRSVVEMIGTLDRVTGIPSVGLLDKLTADENADLQAEMNRRRQAAEKSNRQYCAESVARHIGLAADCLVAGEYALRAEQASEIWASMAKLSKALRKAGHAKPAKRPKVEGVGVSPKTPQAPEPVANVEITAGPAAAPAKP